jgi:hypothetical protein
MGTRPFENECESLICVFSYFRVFFRLGWASTTETWSVLHSRSTRLLDLREREELCSDTRLFGSFSLFLQRICGWDKAQLVAVANEFSSYIGLREVPTIEAKTIGKMGLRGTPGLRIENRPQQQGGGGGRGGRGGGRGGGQQRPQSARY